MQTRVAIPSPPVEMTTNHGPVSSFGQVFNNKKSQGALDLPYFLIMLIMTYQMYKQ